LLLTGCIPHADEYRAHKTVENYIKAEMGNPRFLEPVAFSELEKKRYTTPLDSALNYAHIDPTDRKKMEKFVDSENAQRPDKYNSNAKNLDEIEHDRLFYYTLTYSFRIDSSGTKKLVRYRFELDTSYNVVKATDITYDRTKANN
ncbi:MAG: hypothetical protein ACXVB0_02370, partial [Mucilaginibacter sp.]